MPTVAGRISWPQRLLARTGGKKIAVIDAGIGGNRILHDAAANVRFGVNALARFDRDVLAQPGVKYVIVLEGINDLGHAGTSAPESETVSAEDLIAGLKQMIERAHEHGIKIFGATLTPFRRHGLQRLLHAGERGEAEGRERVDPHRPGLRRRDRFRESRARSRGIRTGCCPPTTAATTSTPAMRATRPWGMLST